MALAFKRFGFLASIASLTLLNACATVQLPNQFEGFYINNIPNSTEIHRANYDLVFSLDFTNRYNLENKTKDFAIYGSGWLIDWKKPDKNKKNDPFRVYLATNLHLGDNLQTLGNYSPYNKLDPEYGVTKAFRLAKYTSVKDFVLPSQLGLPNDAKAFVTAQPTVLPKTAFTSRDFVDYSLPKDQVDKKEELTDLHWVRGTKSNTTDSLSYADFSVLEMPLFLDKTTDRKIFNHFIQPAINTYKQLGDSLNIFANPTLDQLKQNRYYVLGYPNLRNSVRTLLVNQTKASIAAAKTIPQQTTQESKTEKPFVVGKSTVKPTLIKNKGDKFNGSTVAWRYDHVAGFQFGQNFQGRHYQQYGKGIVLNHAGFTGGVSGTVVLNDLKKIAGIYFATHFTANGDWGVIQLLRWNAKNSSDETRSVAYDLIFGNSNTKHFYAQFAKQQKTHLYEQITKTRDPQFRFVEKAKKN